MRRHPGHERVLDPKHVLGGCRHQAAHGAQPDRWYACVSSRREHHEARFLTECSYYLQRHSEDDEPAADGSKLHIFPENFRMIAGDARMRNNTWREDMGFSGEDSVFDNKSLWSEKDRANEAMKRQDAIGFNCLNYQAPAEGALMRKGLPEDVSNCVDGLRAEIFFPSCWNGEDDSPNHKDHLRYPTLVQDGECPEGFKKRLPSLFYETIWDVDYAQGRNGRLVLSDGDATGFGYHGDFMVSTFPFSPFSTSLTYFQNGWDQDVLRRAVNECTDPSGVVDMCPIFDLQSRDDQLKCMKTELEVDEEVFGPLDILPGCNAITGVGAYADMSTGCDGDAITGNEDEHVSEDVDNGSADLPDEEEEQNSDSEETPDDEAAPSEEGEAAPVEEAPVEEAPVEEAVADEEAPAADASSSDPYLVVVTVTQYHQEQVVTQVAEADVVYETVSAAPVTEYVNAKRNTHRRRHAHGHKH